MPGSRQAPVAAKPGKGCRSTTHWMCVLFCVVTHWVPCNVNWTCTVGWRVGTPQKTIAYACKKTH